MTTEAHHWRRREGLALTQVDADGFVVDPETEAVFHLNPLGRAIWQELAEPRTTDEIATAIAAAFPETPADDIAGDVRHFLDKLEKAELVERS